MNNQVIQSEEGAQKLLLQHCSEMHISYPDRSFSVNFCEEKIRISHDDDNYVDVSLKNQQVSYKATILGGFALSEEFCGDIEYGDYFFIDWADENSIPQLIFYKHPIEIKRQLKKGQKIELGIERLKRYRVDYSDGVTARFSRIKDHSWDFSFSTQFHGSIRKDKDGSFSIKFKGIRRDADEDGYNEESKFIISRSKYSNNLLLILQDDATVYLVY